MTATRAASPIEEHLHKAQAYGLCARLLDDGVSVSTMKEAAWELTRVLGLLALGDAAALVGLLAELEDMTYLKPLNAGDISPYETRHETSAGSSGGMTFQLADIAGFYRAFGFEVSGERPDHIVPELEFVALLHAKEAYALASGQEEGAEVCAQARRKFLREHLGVWLPELTRRIDEQSSGPGLSAIARCVVALSATEP